MPPFPPRRPFIQFLSVPSKFRFKVAIRLRLIAVFKQPFSASLRILPTLPRDNAVALNYPIPLHRGSLGTFIPATCLTYTKSPTKMAGQASSNK